MFVVEQVGEPGLLNTPVTIVAAEPMRIEERRLRPDNLQVARLEHWLLQIHQGERFEVRLPNGVCPKVGDTLCEGRDPALEQALAIASGD